MVMLVDGDVQYMVSHACGVIFGHCPVRWYSKHDAIENTSKVCAYLYHTV